MNSRMVSSLKPGMGATSTLKLKGHTWLLLTVLVGLGCFTLGLGVCRRNSIGSSSSGFSIGGRTWSSATKQQQTLNLGANPSSAALMKLLPDPSERWLVNCGCGFSGEDMINALLKQQKSIEGLKSLYVDPQVCWTEHPSIHYIQKALGPSEVVAAMKQQQFPQQGWLMKIDIDSVDCEVASAVLAAGFRPRVIIIETMGCFPPPVEFSFISSSACMSHVEACVSEYQEKPWPGNCCLYSCSTQQAVNVMGKHGYKPWAIWAGDVWFLRGDFDNPDSPLMLNLTANNILRTWMEDSAGMRNVYNLHKDHAPKWAELAYAGKKDELKQSVCQVFRERCSAKRLNVSKWTLSLDGQPFCQ